MSMGPYNILFSLLSSRHGIFIGPLEAKTIIGPRCRIFLELPILHSIDIVEMNFERILKRHHFLFTSSSPSLCDLEIKLHCSVPSVREYQCLTSRDLSNDQGHTHTDTHVSWIHRILGQ